MKNLSRDQHIRIKQSDPSFYTRVSSARIRAYMQLSPAAKRAFLDREIDRKQAAIRNIPAKKLAAKKTAQTDKDPDAVNDLIRAKLDSTTPEDRAYWDRFVRDFKARAAERDIHF